MSKQRIVKDEIWDDQWFYDLDPTEKLIWLFLLTNPRNNIAGVFQLNLRWGANSCGLDKDIFQTVLQRFERDKKIKTSDEWIILLNFHKHQSKNPKVERGVLRILTELPKTIGYLLPMDSLCIAYPTLLNSTLLNLTVGETSSPLNKKTMSWNKTSDNYEFGVVDIEGDITLKEIKKPSTKKYPNAPAVRKIFQEVLGTNPTNWKINSNQLKACENLYIERTPEKIKSALEFYLEHKDREYCPMISSPYDLDSKWTKLGEFKLKL